MNETKTTPGGPSAPAPPDALAQVAIDALRRDMDAMRAALEDIDRRVAKRESLAEDDTRKLAELARRLERAEDVLEQLLEHGQKQSAATRDIMLEMLEQSSKLGELVKIIPAISSVPAMGPEVATRAGDAVAAAVAVEFAQRDEARKRRNRVVGAVGGALLAPTAIPHIIDVVVKFAEYVGRHWQ